MNWRCDECQYFHPSHGFSRGECRRNPPANNQDNPFGRWPIVGRDDWCGEYHVTDEIFEKAIRGQLES